MQATQTQQSFAITPARMVALVDSVLERSPTLPLPPPRRFDSLIRQAIAQVVGQAAEPWHLFAAGSQPRLNPQPLPPGVRFFHAVVDVMVSRAEMLDEFSRAITEEERGIIIVGGYVSEFSDDFCGNGFRLVWPYPGPPPPWFTSELDGGDLLVMAGQLSRSAGEAFGVGLRDALSGAANQFARTGFARLQNAG